MDSTLPWIEKYRPNELDNIVSHKGVITILNNMLKIDKIPHLILYGPPGTGKTSLIMSCAKKIYGNEYDSMILELNGSDDRGINVVRDQIKEFANTKSMLDKLYGLKPIKYKLVILDEADSMTNDAQFALRRVIENYSNHTRFCLICNYLNKIDIALQSRCIIFKLGPIDNKMHIEHIKKLSNIEKINISDECINGIVELSEGDMRKSINILQSLYLTSNNITLDLLYKSLGYPHPDENNKILNIILDKNVNVKNTYEILLKYKENKNISVNDILKEFTKLLVNKNLSNMKLAYILDNLAKIENRLINNVTPEIQLAAIISIIKYADYLVTQQYYDQSMVLF
jgi:replication factor C subunit 3/5